RRRGRRAVRLARRAALEPARRHRRGVDADGAERIGAGGRGRAALGDRAARALARAFAHARKTSGGGVVSRLPVAFALLFVACDDGSASRIPDGGGADLSALPGDFGAPDLVAVDATCVHQTFMSFGGISSSERRLDCTCGCTIDKFDGSLVNGWWGLAM